MGIASAAVLATLLAACSATGVASSAPPTASTDASRAAMTASPSVAATLDPTGLRWVEGGTPGLATSTDPDIAHEFSVLGWSKGDLGFTSVFSKSKGILQRILVTSSTDGHHWRATGDLDLGTDPTVVVVTQIAEGPAGLLVTAEQEGCALGKAALRMWRSADGATFTPIDINDVFGANSLVGVSGGSAGYVVVAANGNDRVVWTSADGVSWQDRAVPDREFFPASGASFASGFIVAGSTSVTPSRCETTTTEAPASRGSVWQSRDGSSWRSVTVPEILSGNGTTVGVRRLDDSIVMLSEVVSMGDISQTRTWLSGDGLTWQRRDDLAALEPLTDGTRTVFERTTDQGTTFFRLTEDLRLVRLDGGADAPVVGHLGQAAIGPAGIVVAADDGAGSWFASFAP